MDIGKPQRVWEINPKKDPAEKPLELPKEWPERRRPKPKREKAGRAD